MGPPLEFCLVSAKLIKERDDPSPAHFETLNPIMALMVASVITATSVDTIHHHVFDQTSQSWLRRQAKKKPFVKLKAAVDKDAVQCLGLRNVNIQTRVVQQQQCMADTGASVCLGGRPFMRELGLEEANLTKCDLRLYAADNTMMTSSCWE